VTYRVLGFSPLLATLKSSLPRNGHRPPRLQHHSSVLPLAKAWSRLLDPMPFTLLQQSLYGKRSRVRRVATVKCGHSLLRRRCRFQFGSHSSPSPRTNSTSSFPPSKAVALQCTTSKRLCREGRSLPSSSAQMAKRCEPSFRIRCPSRLGSVQSSQTTATSSWRIWLKGSWCRVPMGQPCALKSAVQHGAPKASS
jgi:hypothetical protein